MTFDAPQITESAITSYSINFKGPSVDATLKCDASPCTLETSAIGELKEGTKYSVEVMPVFEKKFVVPFPVASKKRFCDRYTNFLLVDAIDSRNWENANLVLDNCDCDFNWEDNRFLHYTSRTGSEYFLQYAKEPELLRRLISLGADVSKANVLGVTDIECVEILLEGGADVNVRDYTMKVNATMWAFYDACDLDLLQVLVDGGLECPSTRDNTHNSTDLQMAYYGCRDEKDYNKARELLYQCGATY